MKKQISSLTWYCIGHRLVARHQRRHLNTRFDTAQRVSVPLTDIGEGIADVEILKWYVKPNEYVKEFDPLCEVRSDKATVEITAKYSGRVEQIHAFPGSRHKVGSPLVDMTVSDQPEEVVLENSNQSLSTKCLTAEKDQHDTTYQKVLSTPAARRRCQELGVKLDTPNYSTKGYVTMKDVDATVSEIKRETDFSTSLTCDEQNSIKENRRGKRVVPMTVLQRSMLTAMNASLKVPSFGITDEIEMNPYIRFRKDIKGAARIFESSSSILPEIVRRYTLMSFLVKAISLAIKDHAIINSRLLKNSCIELQPNHNIGIAIDGPTGLVVPNIKNVESKSLDTISQEVSRLVTLAKEERLRREDMDDTTLTLSNIGTIGTTMAFPRLPSSEVCMASFSRIQCLPRYNSKGRIARTHVLNATFVGDHRVLDGACLTRFCNSFKAYVENPLCMLLTV